MYRRIVDRASRRIVASSHRRIVAVPCFPVHIPRPSVIGFRIFCRKFNEALCAPQGSDYGNCNPKIVVVTTVVEQ